MFKHLKDPDEIMIGYNSIGGCSTINHMHFQLFDVRHIGDKLYHENVSLQTLWMMDDNISFGKHSKDNMYNAFVIQLGRLKLS